MVDKHTGGPKKVKKMTQTHIPKEDPKEYVMDKRDIRKKENSLVKKIVFSIIFIGVVLLFIVVFVGYNYVMDSLQPLDSANRERIEVEIPVGTSTKGIGEILEEEAIVKDSTVFNYFLKTKNVAEFQAGFYELSPSMELEEIIDVLEKGGNNTPISDDYKILVKEGATLEEIAEEFSRKSNYSKKDFIKVATNEAFIEQLSSTYPKLLTEAIKNEDIKYKLEGYLFPATYDYLSHYTIEEVITTMVGKTDEIMSSYYHTIAEKDLTVHSLLTIASLVEKEGVNLEDRKKIAGVFFNRLKDDMPLQSDISILYALNKHLEYVTIKNTEVDSPYNLYAHKGLGPGPFDNPGEEAIQATLNPEETEYYYFLADLTKGDVYFSKTFEEHLELQNKYIEEKSSE